MVTGIELQKLSKGGQTIQVTATRLFGTTYGVAVAVEHGDLPQPICHPGTSDPAKFDSLDEVVSFLSQVGVKAFQVVI